MDQLLKQAFAPNQSLSGDFEDRVMSSIHKKHQASHQGRTVLITMMLYWSLASLTGAWLWFEKLSAGMSGSGNLKVLLPLMAVIGIGVYLLVRQSRLKLSDLFLGTIR